MAKLIRTEVFTRDDETRWPLAEAIRQRVFVEEQACPPAEEWDEFDDTARHVVAWIDAENGEAQAVGTARWREYAAGVAKLERFAVLPEGRGHGVGARLVAAAIADANASGFEQFVLHAQVQATGLYSRFGFVQVGERFVEAGIEHIKMERKGTPGVVFFDGHCPLCHGSVKFVLPRDRDQLFRFAPLQGETAKRILGPEAAASDTIVLVLDPEGSPLRLERAAAVVAMLRALPRPWPWFGAALAAMPGLVADWCYRLVANNRKRLGEYETCPLPPAQFRSRFLA